MRVDVPDGTEVLGHGVLIRLAHRSLQRPELGGHHLRAQARASRARAQQGAARARANIQKVLEQPRRLHRPVHVIQWVHHPLGAHTARVSSEQCRCRSTTRTGNLGPTDRWLMTCVVLKRDTVKARTSCMKPGMCCRTEEGAKCTLPAT